MKQKYLTKKIIIIGGGAAGFMAAGNERCNITNTVQLSVFLEKFSDKGRFLKPVFYYFLNSELIESFRDIGVPTKVEWGEKVFPENDSAKDVVTFFLNRIKKPGVSIVFKTTVKKLIINNNATTWIKDSSGDGYKIAAQARHKISRIKPVLVPIETANGIPTAVINSRDMSSIIIKNLFFAGEVIDMDARTGGYNLQAAFSTGWIGRL